MRRAGVSDGRPVVVYDGADSTAAARAWWLLRYFGHRDVRVLDGGFRAWTAAGLPVASAAAEPISPRRAARTSRQIPDICRCLTLTRAANLARIGVLLDARAAERYRGENEPVDAIAGHIPGAVNAPTAENVTSDGAFRDAAELAARFGALGPGTVIPVPPRRRLLRFGGDRRARGARAGDRRDPGRAVPRLLVGLDHRPVSCCRHRTVSWYRIVAVSPF